MHLNIALSLCTIFSLAAMEGASSELKKARLDNYEFKTAAELLDQAKIDMLSGAKQDAIIALTQAVDRSESWVEKYHAHFGLAAVHGLECPDEAPNWAAAQNHYKAILQLPEILKPENQEFLNAVRLNILMMTLKTESYFIGLEYGVKLLKENLPAEKKDGISKILEQIIKNGQENQGGEQTTLFIEKYIHCLEESVEGSNAIIKEAKLCGTPRVSKLYGMLLKIHAGLLFKNKRYEESQTKYQTALRCEIPLLLKADVWVQLGLLHKRKNNKELAKMFLEMATREEVQVANPRANTIARILLTRLEK